MKKAFKSFVYIFGIVAIVLVAQIAFASSSFTPTPTSTSTTTTVNYHYVGTPTQTTQVYSWLGVANSTNWVDRSNLLITIPQSNTQVTKDFSVTYDYSALGLTANGTQYVYYLADGTTDTSNILSGPGYFVVGTNPAAQPQPGDNDGTCNPIYATPISQAITSSTPNLCSNGTVTNFSWTDPSNGPWTWTCAPIASTSGTPGNPSNCTATLAANAPTTPTTPASPSTPTPASSATTLGPTTPAQVIGNLNISYSDNYTITNTSASIPISITAAIQTNANFVSFVAPLGTSFQNSQPVLNQLLNAGQTVSATLNFTGLTAGQAYYFSLENVASGLYLNPLQFTTTGGTTPGGSVTTVGAIGSVVSGLLGGSSTPSSSAPSTGLVPQCGRTTGTGTTMCTFNDFMKLISNVLQYGLTVLFIAFTIALVFAGFMIWWLGIKSDKTAIQEKQFRDAKAVFFRMLIGLFIVLTAWALVATIINALGVQKSYVLLDIFSGK